MNTTINKKTYSFSFVGRQNGAIGIRYNISDTYEANSLEEAVAMLGKDYEHGFSVAAKCGSKAFTQEQFEKAVYANLKTNYKGRGMARK